jgi:hypothetical protein
MRVERPAGPRLFSVLHSPLTHDPAAPLQSNFPQIFGYALALYGLSMYHKFKASPSGEIPFGVLAREAATDKITGVMVGGLLLLLLVAQ